jgi:hypothetical protein
MHSPTSPESPPKHPLALILATPGTPEPGGRPWKKRVSLRFSRADALRIDAVRRRLPVRLTRAQMVRTFALYALSVVEQEGDTP